MLKTTFFFNQRKAFYFLFSTALLFASCKKDAENIDGKNQNPTEPPTALNEKSEEGIVLNETDEGVQKLNSTPKLIEGNDSEIKRMDGETSVIHFGDRNSCIYNPSICNSTFVTWPGYIQNTGYGEWGYAWRSYGPGAGFIPHGTGAHFHIIGFLFPKDEPNHKASSHYGSEWFAYYMQRSGVGRINFDLTEIKVKSGTITLWFKAANGSWWYWRSIGPGWWSLPGALNIREFHVRASTGLSTDNYSIDDIVVKGR